MCDSCTSCESLDSGNQRTLVAAEIAECFNGNTSHGIAVERAGAFTVVRLGTEYSGLDEKSLREIERLLALAGNKSPTHMMVDFTDTEFFGAGLLGVLLRCWRNTRANGALVLCGLRPQLAGLVHACRLDSIWACYRTRETAMWMTGPRRGDNWSNSIVVAASTGETLQ